MVAECPRDERHRWLPHRRAIRLIINNQIGFTTAPQSARSSPYCSDVAKTVQAPIFHVNGDDPEACVRVALLAWEYRQTFNKDVVIDMVCYRRHGHNEGDDPSYTQPLMYRAIGERRSVRKLYVESLVKRGDITLEEAEQALSDYQVKLQVALDETRHTPRDRSRRPPPRPLGVLPHIGTGVERSVLDRLFTKLTDYPEGFTVHPKLGKQFDARTTLYDTQGEVDWATAEALAIGSLVLEGHPVRLAGEDSRRGTFSQRHAALIDFETGEPWIPFDNLEGVDRHTHFWVFDSLLSEYAALGFEYGYSHANPDALVMWEAQFGDFVNGAQIIIDQYIVAAEDKWGQHNGVVLLLPHGFEGQGPEHSSARIERFLILAAEDNMQVVNATTAANYFHLLRRQVHQVRHTPLIVFTPKQGLRMRQTALAVRGADPGLVRGGPRRPLRHRSRVRAPRRVLLGKGGMGRDRRARAPWRSGRDRAASSSSTRCPPTGCSRSCCRTRTPRRSSGCRRNRRTWGRGASSSTARGGSRSAVTTSATSPASSPGARRPVRRRSTTRSSRT